MIQNNRFESGHKGPKGDVMAFKLKPMLDRAGSFPLRIMFPLLLVIVQLPFRSLRQAAFSSGSLSGPTLLYLVFAILIAVAWLINEFLYAQNLRRSFRELQIDDVISRTWALLLFGTSFLVIGRYQFLPWFMVVPTVATIIETYIAGWASINNAAQKPMFERVEKTNHN